MNDRKEHIVQWVQKHDKVDITDLSARFQVSTMTVRRDLNSLEEEGKIIRTHGGAVAAPQWRPETAYQLKESANKAEKKAIARAAASSVTDHSSLILDSGTTTLELARFLKERKGLRIVTNDVLIAAELIHAPIEVIVTGGELQHEVGTMFGTHTQNLLQSIHVDQCFLGAHSVDSEGEVRAPSIEKAKIKQLMMGVSNETWLLADHSKFGYKTFAHVCHLEELKGLITDEQMQLRHLHDNVVVAKVEGDT
ncbi:DeoR/GlpR family DNA-binding transcription regulator [Natribacillus halophilus]|uniref:DNA-binding transcriptional regulator of sugar metabolism, DeoR/GlpR family n=1 Tax=Natribacillus halophilus TaxID=549003 RepID=A0A1G8MTP0_9BACI|nr:DeoR/GlpR family DNA-binding transcription regulator [Natribacillus halophilus]SDI71274.1 DNA-binding transcriptional regulator of sugar metabolism, DeoR/GlpR family [Natribacillus halophilus]